MWIYIWKIEYLDIKIFELIASLPKSKLLGGNYCFKHFINCMVNPDKNLLYIEY